jgi:hypothetical protein
LTVATAQGLLVNDPVGTVITAADSATTQGGAVAVDLASGAFVYDPPSGTQNVDDTFTYTVAGFDPVTVTVTLNERVWFVKNDDPGTNQGTLLNPFLTLAQAEAASDANDTIFVFASAQSDLGQDLGIDLQTGQKLLGKGVGLRVNGVPVVDPFPNATISNLGLGAAAAGDIPVVLLDNGNEVAGFNIIASFNEGILALGGSGHELHDNMITFGADGREGIRLLNVTGTNSIEANTITASPRDAIKIANNEDQAGDNAVEPTVVTASLIISRNELDSPEDDGIRIDLDGTGTDVTFNILTNIITNPGTGGGDEGININGLGAAVISALISRNTVSGSADQGIELNAGGTSSISSFIANSDLFGNAGTTDFLAAVPDTAGVSSLCLEVANNVTTDVVGSTFSVSNNALDTGIVDLFDAGDNDSAVGTAGTVDTTIAEGACGVALDGPTLFAANCAICHFGNGLGSLGGLGSNITDATVAMINFQRANNPLMVDIALTDR